MRTVNAKCGSVIPIGRLGENEATAVVFDVAEYEQLFGAGTASVLHQRNGDQAPYPCGTIYRDHAVTWIVNSADVAVQGYGKCELIYTVGGVIAKSVIYTTVTGTALTGGAEPPAPWEDWVESVLAAGEAAEEAKEEWQNMTAEAETLPAGTPATAIYANGVLSLGIPKGDTGSQGPRGDTGPAGPQGPKGDKGDKGEGASSWDQLTDKPFDTIGDNLKIVGRALTVDTAPNVQQDNTKPITSAAVYTEVGNINALLALI